MFLLVLVCVFVTQRTTESLFVQIAATYNKQSVTFKQNTSQSMYSKPEFMAQQGQKTETF